MRLLLLLSATILAASSLKAGWLQNAGVWWRQVIAGNVSGTDAATLDGRAITSLLAARQRQKASPMMPDLQLQQWLLNRLGTDTSDMDALREEAQKACPQYLQIASLKARNATADGLIEQITACPELIAKDFTHVAAVVEPAMLGLGWQAVVLAGQRLPAFSPEALSDPKQDMFFSTCSLCNRGQPCQIPRHSRSLSLECPHCHRIYAILAADARGQFRYVNEFLTGYAPPARYPRGKTRLAELMAIWRAVATECTYLPDSGDDDNDAWQTALETQTLGRGDCEDSSILLADWLITRGFEARVALGRYAERGGHAWVAVKLDGQSYLLESTEGSCAEDRPPLLAEVGSRYVPETLFDPMAFFIRKRPQEAWNGDYWTDRTWERVVPRPRDVVKGRESMVSNHADQPVHR